LPPGTDLTQRSLNRVDIHTGDQEALLIELAYGPEWTLEMVARQTPPGTCPGGEGPDPSTANYMPFTILGRQAARLRVEDGFIWSIPDGNDMNILPVEFYKLPGECAQDWPDNFLKSDDVVFLWGYSDTQIPLMLIMDYYSSQFTTENLQNRKIDFDVVHMMDQVVQSLRLTK